MRHTWCVQPLLRRRYGTRTCVCSTSTLSSCQSSPIDHWNIHAINHSRIGAILSTGTVGQLHSVALITKTAFTASNEALNFAGEMVDSRRLFSRLNFLKLMTKPQHAARLRVSFLSFARSYGWNTRHAQCVV